MGSVTTTDFKPVMAAGSLCVFLHLCVHKNVFFKSHRFLNRSPCNLVLYIIKKKTKTISKLSWKQ